MRQTTTTKAKKTIKQAIRVDTAPQKDDLDHYFSTYDLYTPPIAANTDSTGLLRAFKTMPIT